MTVYSKWFQKFFMGVVVVEMDRYMAAVDGDR